MKQKLDTTLADKLLNDMQRDSRMHPDVFYAANQKNYSLFKGMLGSWCGQCQGLNCSNTSHTKRLLVSEHVPAQDVATAIRHLTYYSEGTWDETGSAPIWTNPNPSSLTPEQIDVLHRFSQHPMWTHVCQSAEVQEQLKNLLKRSAQNIHEPGLSLLLPNIQHPERTSALAVCNQKDILDVVTDWTWSAKHRKMLEPYFVSALDPQQLKTDPKFQKLLADSDAFKSNVFIAIVNKIFKKRDQSVTAPVVQRKI